MPHPFGDGKALPRGQLDRPTVQVNHEPPLYHVKELVFFIVLVPVKLSLHDPQPHHAVVHPA